MYKYNKIETRKEGRKEGTIYPTSQHEVHKGSLYTRRVIKCMVPRGDTCVATKANMRCIKEAYVQEESYVHGSKR